jgi:hypothetical protein
LALQNFEIFFSGRKIAN